MSDIRKSYDAEHVNGADGQENALHHVRTAGSISLSPELFERLYLQPRNEVKGDLRKTFANPTPIALVGFLLSVSPLSASLMGWRGAGGGGAANIPAYFFFGGILMLLGSILEFILGNTFPFIVFGSFGAFFLSFGGTLQPYFNAAAAFAEGDHAKGLTSPGFVNSFAFFLLSMGVLCFLFLIASLRTNIVFVLIFATLVPSFGILAGSFWAFGAGDVDYGTKLQVAGGAVIFVNACLGWYICFSQILASVDFPIALPLGDLSGVIKGASQRQDQAK